jgi:hypothetical protein
MIVSGEYIVKIKFEGLHVPAGEYSGRLIDHICFEQVYALSKLNNKDVPLKRQAFKVEMIQRQQYPSSSKKK